MNCKKFTFSRHATEQMFARNVSVNDVKDVLKKGERIISYSDDRPYPSYLMFAYIEKRPLHAVVAIDKNEKRCIIITAYEPSLDIWEDDFKTRK